MKADSRVIWMMMPGGRSDMVMKSVRYGPDVIVPCLEDGVAYDADSKRRARESLAGALSSFPRQTIEAFPRINHPSGPYWQADLDVLLAAGVDGVVVPKVESPEEVQAVTDYMSRQSRGSPPPIVPMIETPAGLLRAVEIAKATANVHALLFGREDYSAAVGLMRRHADSLEQLSPELLYARSHVAAAARAAGVGAIDGASFTFVDQDYMKADASLSARIGFTGKLAAHPAHVAAIREGFKPADEDVDVAEQILELARKLGDAGEAAVGAVSGMEVTPPIVEQARLVVQRAEWATRSEQRVVATAKTA